MTKSKVLSCQYFDVTRLLVLATEHNETRRLKRKKAQPCPASYVDLWGSPWQIIMEKPRSIMQRK